MAAEALHKHFQQHPKRYRPRDENFDVTGDFTKPKFNSRKSNIYVHEFFNVVQNSSNWESHQNQLHRNLYSHEHDGHARPHKSDRIRSRSFQDSYIANPPSSSLKYEETPIHTFSNSKAQAVLKSRNAIAKLEESYWAHWRPNKSETVKPRKTSNKAHYRVIKKPHPPSQKAESSSSSTDEEGNVEDEEPNDQKEEQGQQVEIEELTATNIEEAAVQVAVEPQVKKSEEIQVPADLSETVVLHTEEENKPTEPPTNEETDEVKPLKHTDSFILTAKRQSEEKPHYQQPRCIKLFRKPVIAGSGGSIVRGGSYPLKSSLKKEKTTIKGNIRLGRPGSPITVQTNRGRKGI